MQIEVLKLKAQLLCGDEVAMGPGKADLLEAIDRDGSISAAGRTLGMSYRRCWTLVDTMNHCFATPLVEAWRGGGARLTPAGRLALAAYRGLERDLALVASGHIAELQRLLAPRPLRSP